MFDAVRNHQRVLLALILLLILPAFVFFGLSGYDRMLGPSDDVAVVAGERISRQSLDQAHRTQMENLRQMLGGQVDVKLFDTPAAKAQTLEQLVTQQALLAEARAKRISVPDGQVRKSVLAIPGLVGEDGKFDFERYKTLLAQQGMSPAGFEMQMKQELALQALARSIQDSAIAPKTVADAMFAIQEERRTVRIRTIDPKAFEASIKPTDEQVRQYYESNAAAFEIPEAADVEFLALDRAALAASATVAESELRTYYEQNKSRYGEPAQRQASHILVKAEGDAAAKASARQKAEAVLAEVRAAPATFAEIAKARSEDPGSAAQGGDLGYFSREMMVGPFAEAAFAMKPGQISDLVESEFGFHIILLTGEKAGGEKPFAEVRPEIEKAFRDQQGAKRFAELADSFTNTVYEQADSLEPAARKYGLKVTRVDGLTRGASSRVAPDSPLRNERLLAALFGAESVRSKRNSEAIETAPGVLVSARVLAHRPASREPLETVKARVEALVVGQEAAKAAKAEGERLLAALKAGGDADAKAIGEFAPPATVTRAVPGELKPDALAAVFALPKEPVPGYAGLDGGTTGYRIVRLERVEGPDPSADQRRKLYQQQVDRLEAQTASAAYVASLKSRTKIERRAIPADSAP